MVVVVAVGSMRWLPCDVTVDDANQRGRWRLDHRSVEQRHESRIDTLDLKQCLFIFEIPPKYLLDCLVT